MVRWVPVIGLALVFLACLFPPARYRLAQGPYSPPAGRMFLLLPPESNDGQYRGIDYGRLGIELLAVGAASGIGIIVSRGGI